MNCMSCKAKLIKSKTVKEYGGIEIKEIPCHRCPKCGEEYFTGEEQRYLEKVAKELGVFGTSRMKRKLGKSGDNVILRLPKEIIEDIGLEAGDSVNLWKEGKKIVISAT